MNIHESPGDHKNRVPAVERALDILEYLISRNEAVSIKEMSENLNIPKVTVFRIIKSLEIKGYVHNQGGKGLYILGAKAISFGSTLTREMNIGQIANSFLYELARLTGQTVQLGVLFEYQVMYIDQIRTSTALTLIVPTHQPFAVNISASGKVLVAHLPEDKQKFFVENTDLKGSTPNTIVDKELFIKELQKVKKQGFALDNEEFARGIRCVAAPIFNEKGENIAALGITGHTQEITEDRMQEMIQHTCGIAEKISREMGYKLALTAVKK